MMIFPYLDSGRGPTFEKFSSSKLISNGIVKKTTNTDEDGPKSKINKKKAQTTGRRYYNESNTLKSTI